MRACRIIVIFLIAFSFLDASFAAANAEWTKYSTGIIESKVNCLLIDSHAPGFILAGTDKAIYRATLTNTSFVPVLQNHGNALAIHQIYRNAAVSSSLYSATNSGLFVSDDLGLTWQSIFSPVNVLARQASSVLVDENTIYVATAGGLYFRQQSGQAWQQVHRDIGQKRVSSLVGDGDYVYAATDSGVYRLAKSKEEVVKVYALGSRSLDEQDVSDGEMALSAQIKDMVVSDDGKKIIVVTTQKIIFSSDQGGTWQQISVQGLPVSGIGKLWIDYTESGAEILYAAGDDGLFSYKNGYWENNVAQFGNISVNDAVKDEEGNIYLASADGIYFKSVAYANTKGLGGGQIDYADMALDYKNEPTIRDVQQMAIEYANVDPKQINSWHNQSRMKAFFPTWSMGLSRADSDIYHWDTGANPDVLTKGRDYVDWSTSLSWDFSDLIWSSDHTSIDSRSKLMSELRQDILDQATRLYFERRRIQMELAAKKEMTMDLYIEKTIRLQELTALLDGLTGGEFSQR
jgi:ligand-binding sensor domain-containing protein